jgi:hypothetical protein
MSAPACHLIIAGLRKSANMFVQRTFEMTLGCTSVRLVDGNEEIVSAKLDELFAARRAVGSGHFLPTEHNLGLLAARRVGKIAILVRDPRDALISWWHHLERPDIKAARLSGRVPMRAIDPNYYELSPEEKLRDLIDRRFDEFQAWIVAWLQVAEGSSTLHCHINRFEDFAADQRRALRAMLAFFGHDLDPVLPDLGGEKVAGIQATTHFRVGRAGSYRREAPPELVRLFDERLDRRLAARMRWT